MKEQVFIELDNGEFLRGRKALANLFKGLTGRFTVTLEKTKRKRSNNQNRYLWGVVYPLVRDGFKDLGNKESIETIHEFLKARFLKKEIVHEDTGEVLSFTRSTTDLSTSEMMDYIAEIQQFSAEYLNVVIPDPNEQVSMFS